MLFRSNSFDISLVHLFQKGVQSPTSKVDAAANVADDCRGGILGLEGLDLPLEVFFLVGAADACVEDGFSSSQLC